MFCRTHELSIVLGLLPPSLRRLCLSFLLSASLFVSSSPPARRSAISLIGLHLSSTHLSDPFSSRTITFKPHSEGIACICCLVVPLDLLYHAHYGVPTLLSQRQWLQLWILSSPPTECPAPVGLVFLVCVCVPLFPCPCLCPTTDQPPSGRSRLQVRSRSRSRSQGRNGEHPREPTVSQLYQTNAGPHARSRPFPHQRRKFKATGFNAGKSALCPTVFSSTR